MFEDMINYDDVWEQLTIMINTEQSIKYKVK